MGGQALERAAVAGITTAVAGPPLVGQPTPLHNAIGETWDRLTALNQAQTGQPPTNGQPPAGR